MGSCAWRSLRRAGARGWGSGPNVPLSFCSRQSSSPPPALAACRQLSVYANVSFTYFLLRSQFFLYQVYKIKINFYLRLNLFAVWVLSLWADILKLKLKINFSWTFFGIFFRGQETSSMLISSRPNNVSITLIKMYFAYVLIFLKGERRWAEGGPATERVNRLCRRSRLRKTPDFPPAGIAVPITLTDHKHLHFLKMLFPKYRHFLI